MIYGTNNNTNDLYGNDNGFERIKSGMTSAQKVQNGFKKMMDTGKAIATILSASG